MTEKPAPALQRHTVPPGTASLADHERLAREQLDDNAWAYFSGGAADEITLAANRSAWDQITLQPRVLRALAGGHTRTALLGRTLAHPILLAPIAFQRLAHPDGELASACAAAALGAGMVLSTQSSTPVEAVAQAMQGDPASGPLWFQLYLQHDRGFTRELVQRAEAAGCEALVLTVDAPTSGARDRERRAGFRLPAGISAVHLAGLSPAPVRPLSPGQSPLFDSLLHHAPTWADVQWLQSATRLPLLLKGVLHPEDARLAAALGVAGLIVSNHGGRTLDTAPATAARPAPCGPGRAGRCAAAGGRRHPPRHRRAQGHGAGRQRRAARAPGRLWPGARGRRRGRACAAAAARRAGNRHGTDRVRHPAPCHAGFARPSGPANFYTTARRVIVNATDSHLYFRHPLNRPHTPALLP